MHPIIQKTLGGLSRQYYFRQLFFGLVIAAFTYYMSTQGGKAPMPIGMMVFTVVTTLLYPYSRFVYESIMGYIMGNNIFIGNAIIMLMVKFMTMVMCWAGALLIAPIGLAYLYYHHTKAGN